MATLRGLLADAGRVLAHEGQGDYVAGHVSLRLPDRPDRFLMKPAGIGLEEMTDDNIITVDIDGNKSPAAPAGTTKSSSIPRFCARGPTCRRSCTRTRPMLSSSRP